MKKIFKSISASVTAFIIASTMVVSASAASSADVVTGVGLNVLFLQLNQQVFLLTMYQSLRTTLILTLQSSALLTMITW